MSTDEENESSKRPKLGGTFPIDESDLNSLLMVVTSKERPEVKEVEKALQVLKACVQECEYILAVENDDSKLVLKAWRKHWKTALTEDRNHKYPVDQVETFLDEVCARVIIPPTFRDYRVPAKHGEVITFQLVNFETREADGSTQKILLDAYSFDYDDEKQSWDFTCRERMCKEISLAEHDEHLEPFEIPDEFPEGSNLQRYDTGLFWTEYDSLGSAFLRDEEEPMSPEDSAVKNSDTNEESANEESDSSTLSNSHVNPDLNVVLQKNKIWQIIVSMSDFREARNIYGFAGQGEDGEHEDDDEGEGDERPDGEENENEDEEDDG